MEDPDGRAENESCTEPPKHSELWAVRVSCVPQGGEYVLSPSSAMSKAFGYKTGWVASLMEVHRVDALFMSVTTGESHDGHGLGGILRWS